jgi:hypothetical protein
VGSPVLDHELNDESQWGKDNPEIVDLISASAYDEFGQYRHRVEVNTHVHFARFNSDDIDDHIDQCVVNAQSTEIEPVPSTINVPNTINKKSPDYNKLCPFFGWLDADIIKNTLSIPPNTRGYQLAPPYVVPSVLLTPH